jgi:hypothetical protein
MRSIANGLGAEAHGSLDVALRNQARIEHNNLKNAITYIKVPKGIEVTWIAGKARWQNSLETGEYFKGGGY